MTAATVALLGAQRPRFLSVPSRVSSAGREAVELAARVGLIADPWQEFVLDGALGERADGQWAAYEVGIVLPRQNGKNAIIEIRELAGLFLFNEELILHSSHEFKSAVEGFLRIRQLVESSDQLRKRVARIRTSHGDEGIELLPTPTYISGPGGRQASVGRAARLRFVARTGGSGRGFSADALIFDEAFNLPGQVISALQPTLRSRANPQIFYTSSAVDQEIHPHGVTLARVRERGLAGDDPSLAYFEWCADEVAYRLDPTVSGMDRQQWAAANPAFGIRLTEETMQRECRSMGPASKSFATELLGIGDWPDTDPAGSYAIDRAQWDSLVDAGSQVVGPVVFALAASPDRSWGAIVAVGARSDGLVHGEVVEHREGMRWMLPRTLGLCQAHEWVAVLLDPASATGSLIPGLQEAGVEPELVTGREWAAACGEFYDLVMETGGFRHLGQPSMWSGLAGAKRRVVGDAWAWDRRRSDADITPVDAMTLGVHGHAKHAGDDVGPPNLWL